MSRTGYWPAAAPAGRPSSNDCAPARPVAADPAAGGVTGQAVPAAPAGAPVAPGGPLPPRSGAALPAGSAIDGQVKLSRLADLLVEAAGILRELGEIQLADARNSRLMDDVNPTPERRRLLRVQELAELLQVQDRTIRRMRARGELPPAIDLHSVLRWDAATVDAWLEGRREQ